MNHWSYGINSHHHTASVYLEKAHWWVFALERLVDAVCGKFPEIRLPHIKMKLRDPDDVEMEGKEYTYWDEWWGDTQQVFCVYVHHPVLHYCWRKTKTRDIEIDFERLKSMFYDEDKDFWDEEAQIGEDLKAGASRSSEALSTGESGV